jgi:EAL and modified HD-GYP domain-containing signal transduction protein
MFAFVARQPILDRNKEVYAYELLFRDGKANCYPDIEPDERTSRIIANNYLSLGLDDLSCHKTSFINFNRDTLLNRFPTTLDPETVVVEIVENTPNNGNLLDACRKIKDMGFKLALDDHDFNPNWDILLPYVDIIKVDILRSNKALLEHDIPKLLDANIKLVAERVETQEDFGICKDMGFDFFQGYFFSRPEVIRQKNLPTSKASVVDLIGESSSESFDIERLNLIVERDVGLSYMLLRFINNPTINKRYKITSLRHALTYMGEVEIKKFIALLALANLGDSKPLELIHLSVVRAKFCDLVAKANGIGDNPPTGFLTGLFSLLDALLDQKMEDIIEKLPIVEEVKFALNGGKNELGLYLQLVRAFESAAWSSVKRIADAMNIDQKRLHSLFNESIVWGNGIRKSISPHFPKSEA